MVQECRNEMCPNFFIKDKREVTMIIHQRELNYKENYTAYFETLAKMKVLLEKKFPEISVEIMYNLAGQRGHATMQIRYPSLADYERIDAEVDKDEEYNELIDSILSASGQLPIDQFYRTI